MQRWHLTAGLAGTLALTAYAVPRVSPVAAHTVAGTQAVAVVGHNPPGTTVAVPTVVAGGLSLTAGLDRTALAAGRAEERYLVVTITGDDVLDQPRRAVNVALVVDRSGSMAGEKIARARDAAHALVDRLGPEDRFSMVAFSDGADVLVPSVRVTDREDLHRRVDLLAARGNTNLDAGLTLGLDQLSAWASAPAADRVLLLSDGLANAGNSSADYLARLAGSEARQGISVSAVGVGLDYNEDLLARVAELGGGSFHHVGSSSELAAVLGEELHRVQAVVASGVQVTFRPGPGVQVLEALGYEATSAAGTTVVHVGDVHGGDARKVVLRVRVTAGEAGSLVDVGSVTAQAADGSGLAPVAVSALATADAETLARAVDAKRSAEADKAQVSKLAWEAVQAWERGDVAGAQAVARSSRLLAGESAARYGDADLLRQAASLQDLETALPTAAPESAAGRDLRKQAKEDSVDWSR